MSGKVKLNNPTMRHFILVTTIAALALVRPVEPKQVQDDRPRELAGISFSESFGFKDDIELDLSANIIPRMLYRLRKSSPATLQRFSNYSKNKTWNDVVEHTIDHRFWLFQFQASLKSVQRVSLDAPNTPDSIQYFYRCTCVATDDRGAQTNCTVLTRTLPKPLRDKTIIDEPIRFTGLLYCRAIQSDQADQDQPGPNQTTTVFIADRLSWFPDRTEVADANMVALASRGFDVGQLDRIRASNGRALGRTDREAFFQLIATTTKRQTRDQRPVPLESIISQSSEHIGARVRISAHCRECTRIAIPDPDIQQRYGIDHYFQLMLFPNFEQKIVLTEKQNGEPTQVTVDRYPVTLCCSRLPNGLTPSDVRKSLVSIDGTFFRIWKFQSELTRKSKLTGTISPLIIADQPVLQQPSFWLNEIVSWVFWAAATMIIGLYFYFRFFAGQRPRRTESMLNQLPETIDTSGLD